MSNRLRTQILASIVIPFLFNGGLALAEDRISESYNACRDTAANFYEFLDTLENDTQRQKIQEIWYNENVPDYYFHKGGEGTPGVEDPCKEDAKVAEWLPEQFEIEYTFGRFASHVPVSRLKEVALQDGYGVVGYVKTNDKEREKLSGATRLGYNPTATRTGDETQVKYIPHLKYTIPYIKYTASVNMYGHYNCNSVEFYDRQYRASKRVSEFFPDSVMKDADLVQIGRDLLILKMPDGVKVVVQGESFSRFSWLTDFYDHFEEKWDFEKLNRTHSQIFNVSEGSRDSDAFLACERKFNILRRELAKQNKEGYK